MTPLVVLLIVAAPLFLLAWRGEIYPRQRLLSLALVAAASSFVLIYSENWLPAILVLDGALVIAAVADLLTLPGAAAFFAERTVARIASLGQLHPARIIVGNRSPRDFRLEVRDTLPAELVPDPATFSVELAPQSRAVLPYRIRASRRGAFTLEAIHVRVVSRYGLWQRIFRYSVRDEINVYPNLVQLKEYALLARTNRQSLMGVRRTRRIGQDNEFERLRDYTPDDNYRHLDWRATARRHKLTVRDYQTNQSQRLIFMLDCGRMMTNVSRGLSFVDHALNSLLLLAYVALRQGDSVGLIGFGEDVYSFVPPRGGMSQVNRLLHASFDRFPSMVESNYEEAFSQLANRCRKRALVVLVTNVIDEVNAARIRRYLGNLGGRHLTLAVLLRDHQVFDAADAETPDDVSLFRAAAAADILLWRQKVLADLTAEGVMVLDTFPEDLTAPLVNRYLDVKARHLL